MKIFLIAKRKARFVLAFFMSKIKEVVHIAKGKYEYWLTEEGLLKIEDWARQGLTDEQISENMGISRTTLYNWCNKYVNILNTLKKGKEIVDIQVENALLKRALGYTTTETKIKKEYGEITEEITIRKEVPPDPTSAIFWLKNRRPEQWREKREVVLEDETVKESWFVDDEDNKQKKLK